MPFLLTSYGSFQVWPQISDNRPIEKWSLCPLSLHLDGLVLYPPVKYGRNVMWLPKLGLKRSSDFLLTHWDTFSGSPELLCKRSDYPETTMMKSCICISVDSYFPSSTNTLQNHHVMIGKMLNFMCQRLNSNKFKFNRGAYWLICLGRILD